MTNKTTRGASFTDPLYDQIEAKWEKQYGLPSGGMKAIRTKGEQSNANQVSPVGARTVYQIMPATRGLFQKKYGVDAYASPEAAAQVAALHLKESMDRNGGSWVDAVGEYHGGPDRSKWGPINKAYRARVTGKGQPVAKYSKEVRGTTITETSLKDVSFEEFFHSRPDELFAGTRHGPMPAPKAPKKSVKDMVTAALAGGDGITVAAPDETQNTADRDAAVKTWKAEETFNRRQSHWDHFKAGMKETLTGRMIDTLLEDHEEFDPKFTMNWRENAKAIDGFAKNDEEADALWEATSQEHFDHIKGKILASRENEKVINSSASPTLLRLGTGVLDPAGWLAGAGVGKGFQMAEVGSQALIAAGRPLAGIASAAAEGAVGNVAVTAMLDANGDYVTPQDYTMSALTGLAIGTFLGGHGVYKDASDHAAATSLITEAVDRQRATMDDMTMRVRTELGEAATPEQVTEEVNRRITQDIRDIREYALADVPPEQRLMVAEEVLTEDPAFKAKIEQGADLASVSEETERAMVAEAIARAQIIADSTKIDKAAFSKLLAAWGQESTAARLLKSESPVARAVGLTLLESAQGAGGRRRTAAIALAQRERIYNQGLAGYDKLAKAFNRELGIGSGADFWHGKGRNQFARRVMMDLEGRGTPHYVPDESRHVVQAADLFENGMDTMRLDQQHVGTVGAARLGDNSVGYVPHRLDPRKVLALTTEQSKRVRGILAGQFRDIEGFDAAFSDKLAARYLERATMAGNGSYQVPFNLHSPEAGQIVRDALEGMGMAGDELEKLMGKFSRGGASHTKRRLKLDLSADIGDGMQLVDLFNTDIPSLYRGYARRVAGEVALAQYGVMGKKGLQVLRRAAEATGANANELEAFDQIAAEFLNTPFGNARHAWMDNVRLATSASRLGGMAFTQFAEFGNAIPALGVQGMLRGIAALPRTIADIRAMAKGKATTNPWLRDLDLLGGEIGLDEYKLTRMVDVRDNDVQLYNSESLGVVTRTLRAASHANMVLSGHRMIMASQVRGMAEQIVRKAIKYAKEGGMDTALDDMGIHQGLREAIRADLDRIAVFDAKGNLTELNLFNGKALKPHMVAELSQAIERGAGQIIQRTFVGETGAWAHNDFLKMLFQFRTFSLTSVEKQWGRNVNNYGALKSFMYLAGSASFALPIHMARVQMKASEKRTEAERQKYLDDNLNPIALTRATMNYASAAGVSGDILDVGASVFSSFGGDFGERFGDEYGVRGTRARNFVGGMVAPGAGVINDLYAGVANGDAKRLARSLPGSNLPYVSPFVAQALRAGDTE